MCARSASAVSLRDSFLDKICCGANDTCKLILTSRNTTLVYQLEHSGMVVKLQIAYLLIFLLSLHSQFTRKLTGLGYEIMLQLNSLLQKTVLFISLLLLQGLPALQHPLGSLKRKKKEVTTINAKPLTTVVCTLPSICYIPNPNHINQCIGYGW